MSESDARDSRPTRADVESAARRATERYPQLLDGLETAEQEHRRSEPPGVGDIIGTEHPFRDGVQPPTDREGGGKRDDGRARGSERE